jgi:hypothetical protein
MTVPKKERILSVSDVLRSPRVFLVNSVRGRVPAIVVSSSEPV